MWVKREDYTANLLQIARLESDLKSNIAEVSRLQREIDYWKAKFEAEQNRADRISDRSLTVSGLGPVSDLGVKELDTFSTTYAKMMREAEKASIEMFADEIPGGEEEGLTVSPGLLEVIGTGLKE